MPRSYGVVVPTKRARRHSVATNQLAAGLAFVHLVFAMSDTKAWSEL
jgi:hypothetical protein